MESSMSQQERSSRDLETTPHARFPRSERSIRYRSGYCSLLMVLASLLVGVLVGILCTLLYISSVHDVSAPVSQTLPDQTPAIVLQLTQAYLSQVVAKDISSANLPGHITDIHVTVVSNAPITITGNEQVIILGFTVTRPFTIHLQPVVRACQIQIGITHADLSGIPITTFVSPLEQQINQQLTNQGNSSMLPKGFLYCATDVHTATNGVIVTYTARSA
jgi:hypothetical protein